MQQLILARDLLKKIKLLLVVNASDIDAGTVLLQEDNILFVVISKKSSVSNRESILMFKEFLALIPAT